MLEWGGIYNLSIWNLRILREGGMGLTHPSTPRLRRDKKAEPQITQIGKGDGDGIVG